MFCVLGVYFYLAVEMVCVNFILVMKFKDLLTLVVAVTPLDKKRQCTPQAT